MDKIDPFGSSDVYVADAILRRTANTTNPPQSVGSPAAAIGPLPRRNAVAAPLRFKGIDENVRATDDRFECRDQRRALAVSAHATSAPRSSSPTDRAPVSAMATRISLANRAKRLATPASPAAARA